MPGGLISGEQVWTVEGEYEYIMRLPAAVTDNLPIGSGPYDLTPSVQNSITPQDFSATLHGAVLPPAGAPNTPINF